ncbi:MAG TPA: BON domain-containing protein [Gammaproteobacteria bacterium]|nr:BON domain-containing protein [Gammaproteobacteria bacterium]
MKIKNLLTSSLMIIFLQSCAMNAAVTGAQAVYNRHSIKSTLNDHYITMKSERKIYVDTDRFQNTNVSVASFNGVVLITGQVENTAQRLEIEDIVKNIPGASIREIHNAVILSNSASSLTKISDAWITTKIKSKLIAMDDIDPDQIKVITENGVVYLMGIIPHEQAEIAVDIAKMTEGVQSVVKVFSYIQISKV